MAGGRALKYLLDTNIISEVRKTARAHPNVIEWVNRTAPAEIGTSVVVLAEIRRGIELKRRRDPAQGDALDQWFEKMRAGLGSRVTDIDEAIAERWARLNVPNPLPFIDGLLAATAIERNLILVTRNISDVSTTAVALLDPFSS